MMMSCLGMAKQPTQPETGESSKIDVEISIPARIRLNDGRLLAYTERGVPKNKSNYRVIVVHGFASSKEMNFMASEELKLTKISEFRRAFFVLLARWLVFVAAVWIQSCAGIGYLFGSISPEIKSSLHYNQRQVARLGVAKD